MNIISFSFNRFNYVEIRWFNDPDNAFVERIIHFWYLDMFVFKYYDVDVSQLQDYQILKCM